METEELYGSTRNDLENRIHDFLDNPEVLYRDIRYSRDEDGDYVATILYEHKSDYKE